MGDIGCRTSCAGPAVAPGYGGYAVIPEGDSQGSGGSGLAGMQSVPYMLELVRADDIEAVAGGDVENQGLI